MSARKKDMDDQGVPVARWYALRIYSGHERKVKEAGLKKGSGEPNRNKVGTVTREQVRKIADLKRPDLNAFDSKGAEEMIMGTARSMGIAVQD